MIFFVRSESGNDLVNVIGEVALLDSFLARHDLLVEVFLEVVCDFLKEALDFLFGDGSQTQLLKVPLLPDEL